MKTTRFILSLVLLTAVWAIPGRAAERTAIKGILISASNDKGPTDRLLAPYEPTLRRILRFESYRYLGEDSTALNVPAKGELLIGSGHRLEIETESADGPGIHVRVRWLAGGHTLMNTALILRPGVPAVIGGPATGNKSDVYAVILTGR